MTEEFTEAAHSDMLKKAYTKVVPGNPEFGQPEGTGFRPAFHALWHLEVLGVLESLDAPKSDPRREAAAFAEKATKNDPPMRVAIIDTPVDFTHPNLQGAIDTGLMRDFSRRDMGEFLVRRGDEFEQDDADSRIWLREVAENHEDELSDAIVEELDWIEESKSDIDSGTIPSEITRVFGAHGTAVAGLIGARPAVVRFRKPACFKAGVGDERKQTADASESEDLELPYAGVNPFCRIIPISVSAVPRPSMLRNAVRYARLIRPDIVVIADSWDRPRKLDDHSEKKEWDDLDEVFLALWRDIKVFCAAGNEALDRPVYPASQCTAPNGPWAVGACDDTATDLSYSPRQGKIVNGGGWMIKTLSTELPCFDTGKTVVDQWAIKDKDLGRPLPDDDRVYPARDIVTTDLAGRAGYNPSPYEHVPGKSGEHYEIASLFCRFAGTSAAVAIVGGLVSLIPRDRTVDLDRAGKHPCDLEKPGQNLERLFDVAACDFLFGNGAEGTDDKNLLHGCSPSACVSTPQAWHIAMPSGESGIHPISCCYFTGLQSKAKNKKPRNRCDQGYNPEFALCKTRRV